MPRTHILFLLAASGLAACSDRPTSLVRPRPDAAVAAGIQLQGYTAIELPLLPAGINDAGVIAGTYGDASTQYAAVFSNGALTLLAQPAYVKGNYYASAINSNGAIVGGMQDGSGLFWRSADSIPLQIKSPHGLAVKPVAVNDGNVVVGMYAVPDGADRVFRWTPPTSRVSTFVDITPDGFGSGMARDVNNSNLVVGWGNASGALHALRWPAVGGATATPLAGIMAMTIRDNGDAVGVGAAFQNVTVWPLAGGAYVLPVTGSNYADDVSSLGRVVGRTWGQLPWRPWTSVGGATTTLPLPNAQVISELGDLRVNRCGSIVGTHIRGSERTGLLWTKLMCDEGTVTKNPG